VKLYEFAAPNRKTGGFFLFATPQGKVLQMFHSLRVKSYSKGEDALYTTCSISLIRPPTLAFLGSTDRK
jgi:hypothetical protein